MAWSATFPEPDTTHAAPSRSRCRARIICSAKNTAPYPVASVRTNEPPHAIPLPPIHLHHTAVVLPRHTKDHLTLRLTDPLDDLLLREVRMLRNRRPDRLEHLRCSLMELGLRRIALDDVVIDLTEERRGHPAILTDFGR